ncbi:MAG: TMEM175 family protein [Gemmatimonadaceae bacterium]
MLRTLLINRSKRGGLKAEEFKWRSRDVSRVEGLSDTVFGFAVTLLIVSLEVPRTSGELLETMRGFVAFALTFAVLFSLWYRQFIFFRRYGLEDTRAVILNGALLLFVLFFVFPFKFLAGAVVNRAMGFGKTVRLPGGRVELAIQPVHFPLLFAIYGFGLGAIFLVFAALYYHAFTKREELALNPLEQYDTMESVRQFLFSASLGVIVGLNGLALWAVRGTSSEDPVAYAFLFLEVVGIVLMLRGRATRNTRRESFLSGLTAPPSPSSEHFPIHAR